VQYHEKPFTEAEFLDKIQAKVLRVFLLSISPLQLCLQVSISSNSRNLLCISSNSCNLLTISTVKLLYTVKEKEGKTYRKPYPLPHGSGLSRLWGRRKMFITRANAAS
jgi:hypothetical protein